MTAIFLYGRPDAETEADAVGFVHRLLIECRQTAVGHPVP